MELSQARAVVTGAARGLGLHFVRALVRAGAQVVAGDLDAAGLRRLRDEVPGVTVVVADVAVEAAACALVDKAHAALGAINLLVNNAGVLRDGLLVARPADGGHKLPAAMWQRVIDVNLTGAYLVTREVAGRMVTDRTGGVIINISSLARSGNPGQSSYAASKAGLDACTRTWALELAEHGIRVGGVAPGVIDTPMLDEISEPAMRDLIAGIPLGRIGTPDDVWRAVQMIIECEFFTGRTIEVDGGARLG
ncbi:MAG TPA: SDR family oxidoreductase [Kofleriaceae bacterium]|nr:SDR family oxidoreductase [Kofleriaceae bacterium]